MPVAVVADVCALVTSVFGCGSSVIVIVVGFMASGILEGNSSYYSMSRNTKSAWIYNGKGLEVHLRASHTTTARRKSIKSSWNFLNRYQESFISITYW
jgi:hypothetical protein